MNAADFRWKTAVMAGFLVAPSGTAAAQDPVAAASPAAPTVGPGAALAFEQQFRDPHYFGNSKPISLAQCANITELTKELWSKKQVLSDFKKRRSDAQVGVIVIIKTEICCTGSRLCAATTAALEKQSTPLVDRFRVYAGWIKENPDHPPEEWSDWEQQLISEYDFVQGPGARVLIMLPTWDGKMYQWYSTADELELNEWYFEARQGETPALERFLRTALQFAPTDVP